MKFSGIVTPLSTCETVSQLLPLVSNPIAASTLTLSPQIDIARKFIRLLFLKTNEGGSCVLDSLFNLPLLSVVSEPGSHQTSYNAFFNACGFVNTTY